MFRRKQSLDAVPRIKAIIDQITRSFQPNTQWAAIPIQAESPSKHLDPRAGQAGLRRRRRRSRVEIDTGTGSRGTWF